MSSIKVLSRAVPRPSSCTFIRQLQRHESTARRHQKLNALPSAPSYTPSSQSASLIMNPPSSAPNVYHTPPKFLPKSDRRRQLYAALSNQPAQEPTNPKSSLIAQTGTPLSIPSFLAQITGKTASANSRTAYLPAPIRPVYKKAYHLTQEQIEEMRRLRTEDPDKWTRVKLAEKFGCSQFFVQLVAKAPEKANRVKALHETARAKWGPRRRMAREDRGRRRESWGRDV